MNVGSSPRTFGVRIGDEPQPKIFTVLAESFIPRLRNMVGSKICIKPLRKSIPAGKHVASPSPTGFKHRYLMSFSHQFVSATKPADAAAGYYYLFGRSSCNRER